MKNENYLLNVSIFGKKTLDIYCFNLILSMYLYLYLYLCVCACACACVYLFIYKAFCLVDAWNWD